MKLWFLCRKCSEPVKEEEVEMHLSNSSEGDYFAIAIWCEKCELSSVYRFKGEK